MNSLDRANELVLRWKANQLNERNEVLANLERTCRPLLPFTTSVSSRGYCGAATMRPEIPTWITIGPRQTLWR